MSTPRRSMAETTIGDLGKGVQRYLPFVLAVLAVVLVVAFLPGKPSGSSNPTGSVAAGSGASAGASGANGAAASAASAGGGTAGGETAGVGGSTSSGGSVAAGGTVGSGGGAGGSVAGGGAGGTVTQPVSTADPFCDAATGRVMLPSLYAAPCEPNFNGNNGGATYPGVTASTITVAVPKTGPGGQAEAQALAAAAHDTDTAAQLQQTGQDYVDMFEHHVQTYGRKIKLVQYTSSYNTADSASAQTAECQADATTVAKQLKAFASWGECPLNSYEQTLANDGVICFCTVTIPNTYYLQWAPYVWGTGLPDEEQSYLLRAEMVCDEIAPYPPKYAGEADLNTPIAKKRKFALLWPGSSAVDPTDIYQAGAQFFAQKLKGCGVTLTEDNSFPLVDPNGPADAAVLMSKYKSEGITSVMFVGDPIDPIFLTDAANKDQYFPEWIQMGSALTDTTIESRNYDQTEWAHNFGITMLPDRVPQTSQDSYSLYYWQFHHQPPAQQGYGPVEVFPYFFTLGVSLAGPNLTPRSFQCGEAPYTSTTHSGWMGKSGGIPCVGKTYRGIFGYPVSPTKYPDRVANAVISWGDQLWPWDDYNMYDDASLIWWDAKASGPDESNHAGTGMFRFVNGGKRYLYGQLPKADIPWFNNANTVTIFSALPAPDIPPTYPFKCYYLCDSPGY